MIKRHCLNVLLRICVLNEVIVHQKILKRVNEIVIGAIGENGLGSSWFVENPTCIYIYFRSTLPFHQCQVESSGFCFMP